MKKRTAEMWLSRQMDGELSPRHRHRLEKHLRGRESGGDRVQAWERLREIVRSQDVPPGRDADETWAGVREAMAIDIARDRSARLPLNFLWSPVGAVASIALVALVAGIVALALQWGGPAPQREMMAEADVEWVESDLPNAVTVVYQDADTGWTVIWVDAENGDGHAGS